MNLFELMKSKFVLPLVLLSNMMLPLKSQNPLALDDYPVPVAPINEYVLGDSYTTFQLWAPAADSVRINLFTEYKEGKESKWLTAQMEKGENGLWTYTFDRRLNNIGYTFQTCYGGQWKAETPGIFAKAVGLNGRRAYCVDMRDTDPEGWNTDELNNPVVPFSNDVIYEMHFRDFSADESAGIKYKGKYLALTEEGTRNKEGLSTGLSHLKELGVTHIHLLPSFDYASVDEGSNKAQYNWGYDPLNYNVPEGSYATDAANPLTRIREFKQMVQHLHRAGFKVVLDVVYNHTFDVNGSNFQLTAPDYFYRRNPDGSLANGSGCGNETASERPLMRKFMIESVLYWIKEYHIDGFRFDLMGIHDIETMNEIRRAVDAVKPGVLIYGEGWASSSPQLPEFQLAMKANVSKVNSVAAFGDELRDGLRGPWDNDANGAFLVGVPGHEESIKFGLVGAVPHPEVNLDKVNYSKKAWAQKATQMISYVSCHDDMCLADRLKATKPGATAKEYERLAKLAETAVFMGQGIPFIFAGDEILRDKKGVHNSYNSPDSVNCITWGCKTAHKDLFDYVCELIKIRQRYDAFHLVDADVIREKMHFIPTKQANLIAYTIEDKAGGLMVVALNSNTKAKGITVPKRDYQVLIKDGKASVEGLATLKGGRIKVDPQSALVIYSPSTPLPF